MSVAAATKYWHRLEVKPGRGDVKQIRLAEQRLEETRKQFIGAAGTDVALIRTALAVRWAGRLADLLEENPDAEADPKSPVQEIQTVLPAERTSADTYAVSANGDVTTDAAEMLGPEHPGALAKRSELAYSIGKTGTRPPRGTSSPHRCRTHNANLGVAITITATCSLAHLRPPSPWLRRTVKSSLPTGNCPADTGKVNN
jgi:hypothetical protein